MSERLNAKQVLQLYLRHAVSEARTASEHFIGSFLIETRFQRRYIKVHILFVCDTDQMDVETEIDEWLKIYRWIENKKDEILRQQRVEDRMMIVLYPRFISLREYWSLSRFDKARLDNTKIIWHKLFNTFS